MALERFADGGGFVYFVQPVQQQDAAFVLQLLLEDGGVAAQGDGLAPQVGGDVLPNALPFGQAAGGVFAQHHAHRPQPLGAETPLVLVQVVLRGGKRFVVVAHEPVAGQAEGEVVDEGGFAGAGRAEDDQAVIFRAAEGF